MLQTYGDVQKLTLGGRALEGQVFARAASLLRAARDVPDDRRKTLDALTYNHRLWTLVQAAVSDPAAGLPPSTASNLLRLSLFVDERTAEILKHPDVSLLDVLIDINRDLAQAQLSTE